MLGALLTPFFFAMSAVTGQRVAVRLGAVRGNLIRLGIATAVLGLLVAFFWPGSLEGETFTWFFVSGLIGFGIGDVALFLAYERLGSRLTILLNLCLAPLFAMLLEWVWLDNGVSFRVIFCAATILTGVILAIRPGAKSRKKIERRGRYGVGVMMAVVAGFGQGAGAVISRKAEAVAVGNEMIINGISAAFQRVFAGLVFAILAMLFLRFILRRSYPEPLKTALEPRLVPWLLGAALFGPVIGVSCFQWALHSLESGIVLAITAMTPIILMPLAAMTEGDHPSRLAILGAVVAVTGVILLNLWA
ncbi:MAG: DMT family transporter [Verrucomicrobiales bacterium]|nr:DMT family transporter [Verrucomicrobiales bacterium]